MPRLKTVVNLPLQESITAEIKKEYGAYLSKNELRQYLRIGKCRADIFEKIPSYSFTPGRTCYRAADIAAYVAKNSAGADRLY